MTEDAIANLVVNSQIDRMVEQERSKLEVIPILEPGRQLSPIDRDKVVRATLRAVVLMKISMSAGLN